MPIPPLILRHCLFFLPALLAIFLSGCGGVSRTATSDAPFSAQATGQSTGQAAFTVNWPDRAASPRLGGRIVPAASNSIVLIVKRDGAVIATQTLARPDSSVILTSLPLGTLTVQAAAYPSLTGTGAIQASASAPLVITSSLTTPLTLTLADTVTSITVSSLSQSLSPGGTLPLIATAQDASGNVVLTRASIDWSSANTATATVSSAGLVSGIAGGNSLIRATDTESGVSGTFSLICISILSYTGSAYGGVPAAIPGKVEAENYDVGGEGVSYHDTDTGNNGSAYRMDDVDIETTSDIDGGYNVGWLNSGEWTKYTVNVATAGSYTVSFRLASPVSGQMLHLEDSNGTNLTGSVACPNTGGYQNWQTVTATATLSAGTQTLKLLHDGPGSGLDNINYLSFIHH